MKKFFTLVVVALFAITPVTMAEQQPHWQTLYDSTSVVMEESGLSHIVRHVRIHLNDAQACKQYNVIKADYDPLTAYVEIRTVRVHHANGTTSEIKSPVLDYVAPARSIYWKSSQKMIEVGRLVPGDELEYTTYKKGFTYALLVGDDDDKYIPPMRGHYYDIVPFWSSVPVDRQVYKLSILSSKTLKYQVYNDDTAAARRINVTTTTEGDRTVYTFVKTDLQPVCTEPNMVAGSDVYCKLLLSTAPDWQSKSRWFYGVNEDYGSFVATPELKAKVNELLKDVTTEFDTLNILTHWVADNMRYSGISMGKGEGYTLHNAKTNFTDRCGVCKDKASLLIAMLRAAGKESYPAMTMAGSRIDRIPADQFNHSVACVRLRNGKFQLLDPTWVPNVRELWSSAEQQQGYLIGTAAGEDLQYTPISDPENHYIRINGRNTITNDGTLKGTLTITAEGQSDAAVRRVFGGKQSAWRSNLEMQLLNIAPQARIISIEHTNSDEYLKQPVSITYKYEIPNYAVIDKKTIIFTPITARNFYKFAMAHLSLDTSLAERKYPFRDRCSRLVQITDTITLPEHYTQMHFPPIFGVANPAASFGCQYWLDEKSNDLYFAETVMMGKRVYDPADWIYVRQCIRHQQFLAQTPVVLTRQK